MAAATTAGVDVPAGWVLRRRGRPRGARRGWGGDLSGLYTQRTLSSEEASREQGKVKRPAASHRNGTAGCLFCMLMIPAFQIEESSNLADSGWLLCVCYSGS